MEVDKQDIHMYNVAFLWKEFLFTASNTVRPMLSLIFPGIEAVVEGDAFAHVVELELLPHFSPRVSLLADAATLGTINDSSSGDHIVFRHSFLPTLKVPIVSPVGDNITWHRTPPGTILT